MSKTYIEGQQDAWLQAIRDNCRNTTKELRDEIKALRDDIKALSGKVNHIYGASMALGAMAGALVMLLRLFWK